MMSVIVAGDDGYFSKLLVASGAHGNLPICSTGIVWADNTKDGEELAPQTPVPTKCFNGASVMACEGCKRCDRDVVSIV